MGRHATGICHFLCRMAEAAAVLSTTAKAVESRLYRARHLLRERLKKWLSRWVEPTAVVAASGRVHLGGTLTRASGHLCWQFS
jgi:hypothetical protein